jgi:glutamate carboxypeptidase
MELRSLLDALRPRRDAMVERLRSWVEHESPTRDKPALDALAGRLAAMLRELGGEVAILPNPGGGDHVRARFFGESHAPHALFLAHFDTVWPLGTLAQMPFRVEDGRAYGPGSYDMKSSLVLLEFALTALRDCGGVPPRPVVVLLTSDEEIGSPTSQALIESEAAGAAYALVPEPPLPGGGLKTARKGVGHFTIEVTGRAAHAGVEPGKGISAIVELAHQILAITRLADPAAGTTLNVGIIEGGSATNVVAASATAKVDVRVTAMAEARRVERAMAGLAPVLSGTSVRVSGGVNRPPMERTEAIAGLFRRARQIGANLDFDLTEGASGGGSDGNITAALGVPTLDGLGTLGDGAHAAYEHVVIDSLPERAALLAALLVGL